MKKLLSLLVSVLLCVCMLVPCATVFAEEDEAQTPVNSSVPRFMLTSYSIDGGYVSPSEQKELSLTLKNYSRDKAIYNVKLSLTDDSAEIQPDGTGIKKIFACSAALFSAVCLHQRTQVTAHMAVREVDVNGCFCV